MRIGLALNCTVQPCIFHRKNYFYPDMPKAYQISQYDVPLNVDGWLDLPDGSRVGIERAHVEEDTGKSTHVGGADGRIHGSDASLIDFNRAGVPLVEIVSRPDLRSAEQARLYVHELRAMLVAIGASDAKMEEGSMRVDANVSVRRPGEPLGTRCEIKNLNSVRSLGPGDRLRGPAPGSTSSRRATAVRQETRHWDEGDGTDAHVAHQGGCGRLPLLPGARPRAARPRCRVDRVGARRDARPAGRSPRRPGGGDGCGPGERVGVGRRRSRPGRLRARRRHCRRRRGARSCPRQGGVRRARARASRTGGRSCRAHPAGGRRIADGDAGQGGARRTRRQWWW